MGRRKPPRELKKHPHTLIDVSLWDAAKQLEMVPWSLRDEHLNSLFFRDMTAADRRRERARINAVKRERAHWQRIVVSVSPPTKSQPLLITVRSTGSLLMIVGGEARIWRRELEYSTGSGAVWRRGWFSIRQRGLFWAHDLARTLNPPVLLEPVTIAAAAADITAGGQ